jgi:hypothetical protein
LIAVISGKIVNSWTVNPNVWLFKLKHFFGSFGGTPHAWEIFGGNAFLLKVSHPEECLFVGLIIKAIFKQFSDIDIALDIGIGTETNIGSSLRTNEGTAYDNCNWRNTAAILKKPHFNIITSNKQLDENMHLLLAFASQNMNTWSHAEAEVVELCLLFPEKSQQELAEWLRIKQSAISQRKARAQLDLLLKLDQYFRNQCSILFKK